MKLVSTFVFLVLSAVMAHAQEGPKDTPPFAAELEAGTVMVSGNSESQSYATKGKAVYTNNQDIYTGFGHYIELKANGVESALNWDAGLRYDREINNYLGAYLGHKAESDIYAGYLQRDASDIGAKYFLVKADETQWTLELGYRYAKTQPRVGTVLNESFGRVYTELNQQYGKAYSLKYWAEYLPNFTTSEGYQVNTELSGNVMLNSIFSVKVAYLLQYLNIAPAGGKHSTATTTMNLVAKF